MKIKSLNLFENNDQLQVSDKDVELIQSKCSFFLHNNADNLRQRKFLYRGMRGIGDINIGEAILLDVDKKRMPKDSSFFFHYLADTMLAKHGDKNGEVLQCSVQPFH